MSDKKTVLVRSYCGDSQYGEFVEQVAISEDKKLYYMKTYIDTNYCAYQRIPECSGWLDEEVALNFIFGDIPKSENLISALKESFIQAKGIVHDRYNDDTINYGQY